MSDGIAKGYETSDQVCLDDYEEVCLDEFYFCWAEHLFDYPSLNNTNIGGVIHFNRYDINNNHLRSQPLVYDLVYDDIFYNTTMQLDFNHM